MEQLAELKWDRRKVWFYDIHQIETNGYFTIYIEMACGASQDFFAGAAEFLVVSVHHNILLINCDMNTIDWRLKVKEISPKTYN